MKKTPRFLLAILILTGFIFLALNLVVNFLKSPLDKNGQIKAFVIEKGESVSSVSERLAKEKLIRSTLVFKYIYKSSGSPLIEAGDFKLSSSMTVDEIIKTLSEGPVDRWVTLIEGWRVEEMAEQLNNKIGIDKTEFIKAAKEGYMFPDTYLFNPDSTAQTIAQTMLSNFDKKYNKELQARILEKGLSAQQGVILASLVEREGRSDKVRTEIAGILLKRFKMGMKLDVDATVQYALGYDQKTKKWWRTVTPEDYKFKSPFNTYLNNGLPPAPICNPSLSSLNAVANADSNTLYLFYYHDSKGNSYYAKTLEEHNDNVAKYR